ncbi:isoprenylcysteine carboxylmethyltransferase family protein [Aliifodinibius salicampi]|uniref:Isoprenylcysteine carboxylmethyltransferase family protein n=1 Tax=Fodinibius salicampi TaxID=1920655 RepID=A0ABT3Q266_9BACT|nr:isoprenylcysteine carboxylmethyltransferase family protein [Fodinibius salicampi]MCW9714199.1 isoprenylcysteine carboxylmethyltransferase family protein [Fodinibius salicampi]
MLKLKIPPAVVAIFFASLMWIMDNFFHFHGTDFRISWWVSVFCFAAGGMIGVVGLIQFYRKSTSINPHKPDSASSLVDSGIYRFSRNPMYLALLLILISYGIYLGNMLAILILPLFVLYMNYFQIIPEEKVLHKKFGEEFEKYRSKVHRWI